MNLCFHWFFKYKPIGEKKTINLNNGDMYIMSEKAVFYDWKKNNIFTLRHSAGIIDSKYTMIKN